MARRFGFHRRRRHLHAHDLQLDPTVGCTYGRRDQRHQRAPRPTRTAPRPTISGLAAPDPHDGDDHQRRTERRDARRALGHPDRAQGHARPGAARGDQPERLLADARPGDGHRAVQAGRIRGRAVGGADRVRRLLERQAASWTGSSGASSRTRPPRCWLSTSGEIDFDLPHRRRGRARGAERRRADHPRPVPGRQRGRLQPDDPSGVRRSRSSGRRCSTRSTARRSSRPSTTATASSSTACSAIPPTTASRRTTLYDPEKAKQLLADADIDMASLPEFVFDTYYNDSLSLGVMTAIQANWAEVGLKRHDPADGSGGMGEEVLRRRRRRRSRSRARRTGPTETSPRPTSCPPPTTRAETARMAGRAGSTRTPRRIA